MSKLEAIFRFGTLHILIVLGLVFKIDVPFYVALGFSIAVIVEVLSNNE